MAGTSRGEKKSSGIEPIERIRMATSTTLQVSHGQQSIAAGCRQRIVGEYLKQSPMEIRRLCLYKKYMATCYLDGEVPSFVLARISHTCLFLLP